MPALVQQCNRSGVSTSGNPKVKTTNSMTEARFKKQMRFMLCTMRNYSKALLMRSEVERREVFSEAPLDKPPPEDSMETPNIKMRTCESLYQYRVNKLADRANRFLLFRCSQAKCFHHVLLLSQPRLHASAVTTAAFFSELAYPL